MQPARRGAALLWLLATASCCSMTAARGQGHAPEPITLEFDTSEGLKRSYRDGWREDSESGGTLGVNVSCLKPGASIYKQFDVPVAGLYEVGIRAAALGSAERLVIDQRPFPVETPPPPTGATGVPWVDVPLGTMELSRGTHTAILTHVRNGTGPTEARQIALVDHAELVLVRRSEEGEETGKHPPDAPTSPDPPDGAQDVPVDTILSWQCTDPDGDPVTCDVYLGTEPSPALAQRVEALRYEPQLEPATTYYWKIIATDGELITQGPVWSFTTATGPAPPPVPEEEEEEEEAPADVEEAEPARPETMVIFGWEVERGKLLMGLGGGGALVLIILAVGIVRRGRRRLAAERPPRALVLEETGSCPSCGATQALDAAFCSSCGAALGEAAAGTACPSCGKPVQPGDAFCAECGAALPALEGEEAEAAEAGGPRCDQCGKPMGPQDGFCGSCGAPRQPADATSEEATLAGDETSEDTLAGGEQAPPEQPE